LEILLLLLLVLAGGLLFVPEFLKERSLGSPVDTISDFKRGMMALAVSTHNYNSRKQQYMYSYSDPEPYVKHRQYTERFDDTAEDIIPYPSQRGRAEMETRRNRVVALLLLIALATGITALIPSMKWIIPLHIVVLVVLAAYIALAILLPHSNRRR
jgi:hypothetical protein